MSSKLSKEKLEKLKRSKLHAVDENTEYTFIPQSCKDRLKDDEDLWPRFTLKPIPHNVGTRIDDRRSEVTLAKGMDKDSVGRVLSGTTREQILVACLVGWENFYDEKGELTAWKSPGVRDEHGEYGELYNRTMRKNIAHIPFVMQGEIADFLEGRSEVTPEEGEESASTSDGAQA